MSESDMLQVQCFFSFGLSLLSATDTGFCFPGISITRWFLHTDFYTQASASSTIWFLHNNFQAVESAVARQFSPAVRQPLVAEWFRSSLPSPAPGEEELLDRAGQLRLLQHLLETTHASMARAAGLHGEEEGGLFLTEEEIEQLNRFYIRESLEQGEERVLYTVGGK